MPAPSAPRALLDIVAQLQCPSCQRNMQPVAQSLRCESGHAYDIARQGYVNMLPGDARPGTADTAEMVQARRDFLEGGHYAPLVTQLWHAAAAALAPGDLVVDAGAGVGHYLRAVLEGAPAVHGLALDLSKYAARHAARVHPRAAALVVDLWRPLPIRTQSTAVLLDVFAPRNPAEFHRVLRPDGTLIVVTPGPRHLIELISALDLLTVDDRKNERLHARLDGYFDAVDARECTTRLRLSGLETRQVVEMGPNAHHLDPVLLTDRIAALSEPVEVTASFLVSTFRRKTL